jgi:protein phosphatase
MQGRGSGAVREFCLYGETSGETDEFGLPVRYNWAADYRGKALVVYGHTPVPDAQWLNGTIDIDTGCVFGGRLTALRYPEKELISVPAAIEYSPPIRPFLNPPESTRSIQQEHDDLLDIADLSGKLILETKYSHNIGIREENTIAALEVMSRFAINPKWLIYLPPTMSPSETSHLEGYLEHPLEAFEYFRSVGVEKVICEEKHMGSRAVVMVGKDTLAISKSFGIEGEGIGVIYTRTGRPYFEDKATEQALLQRLNGALQAAGFFERWNTDWVCLDAELMPWNAKAQVLLERQYGSTGAAGTHALKEAVDALKHADVGMLLTKYAHRAEQVEKFVHAYRQYCWPVKHLEDYKLAPFHILATEGKVWIDETHEVHMKTIAGCYIQDKGILLATPYRIVDIHDETDLHEATEWWMNLTNRGGEGMVVKPMNFIHLHKNRLAQPAIKVRGREYLRIIYGPEYTTRENLDRLKKRGLGSKRALALKEFALGLESLDRFVRKEPLRKVHECVFGVLALESEPIDPRL